MVKTLQNPPMLSTQSTYQADQPVQILCAMIVVVGQSCSTCIKSGNSNAKRQKAQSSAANWLR